MVNVQGPGIAQNEGDDAPEEPIGAIDRAASSTSTIERLPEPEPDKDTLHRH
jgi:hypothetical protein